MDTMQILAATAAFLGLAAAVIMPYWRKRANIPGWDHKYTLEAVVAVIVALAIMENTILAYAEAVDSSGGFIMMLIGAAAYGYGLARLVVETGEWLTKVQMDWRQ